MSSAIHSNERQHSPSNASTEPPPVLVDTWVWMMDSAREPEIQALGKGRLLDTFGDLGSAQNYHRSHCLSRR